MAPKSVVAATYAVAGLFIALTPLFLVDDTASPPSLAQYAGAALLLLTAAAITVDSKPVTEDLGTRGLATLGFGLGLAGLVGQFVL